MLTDDDKKKWLEQAEWRLQYDQQNLLEGMNVPCGGCYCGGCFAYREFCAWFCAKLRSSNEALERIKARALKPSMFGTLSDRAAINQERDVILTALEGTKP